MLLLADLIGAALKALCRSCDVGASGDSTASPTWSRAIYGAGPRWHGIRYVSWQLNNVLAFAIFERSGLRKLRAAKLKPKQVDRLCARFTAD